MFKTFRVIHFIGIGGSGMSGIAEVLLKLGYTVTGSDAADSLVVERLRKLGADIKIGHLPKNIGLANVIVTSTAVLKSNPEVREAIRRGIPVIPRVEMLAEIARLKYTVAIAGTHGKTTTTSLVGQILTGAGLDPTVIVGGRLKSVGTGGVLGKGDFLVAEADESDGSFLKLSPAIAVITNIDDDHMDYYKTEKNLLCSFASFANKVPFYGITLICEDDKKIQKIKSEFHRRFETYGTSEKADWRALKVVMSEVGTSFQVFYKGQLFGSFLSPLSGHHNVLNALAAIAVGNHAGLTSAQIAHGLSEFEGVGRRIEIKGGMGGVTVVDDYGHHPTEIRATLSAVRSRWPRGKMHVFFQPHRFSRTKALYKEFASALSSADHVYLLPIYPASEKPIKGVTTELISRQMKGKNKELWNPSEKAIKDFRKNLKSGDVVLTLGAGDVWKVGEELLKHASPLVEKINSLLPQASSRCKTEEPLSRHTTWAIGGPAEIYFEVHNLSELKTIQALCRDENVPVFILGWGSNVLMPDEGLRGCVIRLRGEFESIVIDGTKVTVGSGVHLPRLAKRTVEQNLTGVESLAGIPGTVGGALITNAGTKNGCIGDAIEAVSVMEKDGSLSVIPKNQIKLNYRSSNLAGKLIVSARLNLKWSKNGDGTKKIKEELSYREKTQPLGTKNVGSVFKNPADNFAAKLIEDVGLKGKEMGRVRFSPKHANFMENLGGASAREVLKLIREAQSRVKEKFGIELEPEVRIIGQNTATHA